MNLLQAGASIFLIRKSSTAASVVFGITTTVILIILALMGLFLFIWFIVVSIH